MTYDWYCQHSLSVIKILNVKKAHISVSLIYLVAGGRMEMPIRRFSTLKIIILLLS
jgi:hypothetical protein